ncbi:MAG: RebB family R body protein [Bryobacterales bacterium]|nr:RebB family R body protein [Bryobacterales bacterium]
MSEQTSLNDQIRDALDQVNATLGGSGRNILEAAAYQAMAQALALGLQNAVAQQQHAYMLRNALTTAAAQAILEGKREEASEVLKLAESKLVNPSLSDALAEARTALRALREELKRSDDPVNSSSSATSAETE